MNTKRIYRLMKKHGLLQRQTGRRRPRKHEGKVVAPRSNMRWCSDGMEFTCWNGEVVRIAFVIDRHDREVIGWIATTAGLSGEMIRDLMAARAPEPIQWLTDNGSIYVAGNTIDLEVALNLVARFTPVEGPESDGVAEAFVKSFKRDYVRINPIPDALIALAAVEGRMEDHNEVHPHSDLAYRAPREYIRASSQPAVCPV